MELATDDQHEPETVEEALSDALASALAQFELGDSWNRRYGATRCLMAIVNYLMIRNPNLPLHQLRPVRELVGCLGDLGNGICDPMFIAERKGGRPPASTQKELLQETAAAAVTILMDGGVREKEAHRQIAERLNRSGAGKRVSPSTIGNWRNWVTRQPKDTVPIYWLRLSQWHNFGARDAPGQFVEQYLWPDLQEFGGGKK